MQNKQREKPKISKIENEDVIFFSQFVMKTCPACDDNESFRVESTFEIRAHDHLLFGSVATEYPVY